MIESIKDRVFSILKEKEVSLAMVFDREGRILWHRGRPIKGKMVQKGEGFSKSSVEAALKGKYLVREEGAAITRSGANLPHSARLLYIKSVRIVPMGDSFFLYVDSGVKHAFSSGDAEVIQAMGELLGEMVEGFKANLSPAGSLGGVSAEMNRVRERVAQYALEEEPVMLYGETGVGKNHVAELIHRLSGRKGGLVVAHTPAIPENLFESELFGHRAGAFTDARERKPGLLEEATGGTLFFDEIAEVPLTFQSKLLRLIDTNQYRPLGETKERKADVRLMAATNRDLAAEVKAGKFRKDLYFRLNVLPLEILPLRQRREDIRPLVLENSRWLRGKELDASAWNVLMGHDWPGNVRELIHVLKRAGIVLAGPVIGGEIAGILENDLDEQEPDRDFPLELAEAIRSGKSFWETAWRAFLARDLNRFQLRRFLQVIYGECGGNLKSMTQKLNIRSEEYPRFISMLHKYQIHPKK